ncbi:hypothetical protein [Planomonospora venezuelensis]|uniref:Uncharacterized protein n=1 Tax=Planomonospora venezuelensis TaxID=1999 RepID=A0A841DCJ3_PLAVE|nr:hypothetical protein [Planomonospora venezuelensis]MBB5965076.1 hypothetical protein [Planomonospora venezuelensis]
MNTIPAEIVRPGRAVQRINAYDRQSRFVRQVRYYGTEVEARAYVVLQGLHDSEPGHAVALAELAR